MTTFAAIRVKDGEIVQRAGRASDVTITPDDDGFILHGALGPAPDRWVQSPDDALIGWDQTDDGIRIWTTHPEPTIRFVPDVPVGEDEAPLPAPDWSRVLSVTEAQEQIKEQQAKQRATEIAQRKVVDDVIDTLPDEEVETLTYLYPKWTSDGTYEIGDKYRHEGILYVCEQGHSGQADRVPGTVPALWSRYRDPQAGPQPWEQLTPPDTYDTGDRVTHDNPNDSGNIWIYESAIDANTTEPGRDSTFDRYWTPVEPA